MEPQTINTEPSMPEIKKEFKKSKGAIILAYLQIFIIIFNVFRVQNHPESLLYYASYWWVIAIIPAFIILFLKFSSEEKSKLMYKIGTNLMIIEYIIFFFYFLSIFLSKF